MRNLPMTDDGTGKPLSPWVDYLLCLLGGIMLVGAVWALSWVLIGLAAWIISEVAQ